MTLNAQWLNTFVTLCEIGHFTRAAASLNMTQPGVSQHLRKLEEQVGQPLVSRDGKSFVPTPAGEALLAIGQRRREEERQLREGLGQDDAETGEVRIGTSGSLALLLYPRFLDLMAQAPGLTVTLEAAPQRRIEDGVLAGELDLGIADHAPRRARLDGQRIGEDELCLILPAAAPPPEDLAALQRLGFIAHPDGFAHADELLGANFPDDYPGADRLRQRSFINQIGQIPDPVARGLGYTILPRSGVETCAQRDRLRVVPLARPIRHELWLVHRRGRVLPARIRRIIEDIRDTLAGAEAGRP
ncbi:LysR family transcriptional regulator [Marinibacterium sp. SX1]|uniref:LysR family transcriptional regulator n=1 Tax=Marinibacterium sp. SX1 TaxID=3388424 RepID=UPI003D17E830